MITEPVKLYFGETTIPNSSNTDTDILDTQGANVAGAGGRVYWNCMISTAMSGGTSCQVKLMHSADGSTWIDLMLTRAVPTAEGVLGYVLAAFGLPPWTRRYLKCNVIGSGTVSAGKVKNWLALEPLTSTVAP